MRSTRVVMVLAIGVLPGAAGCVRRTLTVETEPSGALVYLNDEEVGRSPVTVDFIWYGDYDVICRLEGHQTLSTHATIAAPWYQVVPFDFFAEVFWPGRIVDAHTVSFALESAVAPDREELAARAREMRDRALFAGD